MEDNGIFLNIVNHANISYGGGQVVVNSTSESFDPLHLIDARPTISFNTISNSANAAVSANPNSFEESEFQGLTFTADYERSGPKIYRNTLSNNTINALFVRVRTDTDTGAVIDRMTVPGRFTTTDMVYAIEENLIIGGSPGGYYTDAGGLTARANGRLAIDPGVIVKLGGVRIETQIGTALYAEGTKAKPIVFTSILDDSYGAGGVFDTTNDGASTTPGEGDWGGLFFGPISLGSVDHALIAYGGGTATIEGDSATFNAVEIHQAKVRIANSTLEHNAAGGDTTDRAGRSSTTAAIIFVRGAQPVLLDNIIQNNDTKPLTDINEPLRDTAAISINVNALNATLVMDTGRSTGFADIIDHSLVNSGPLIRGNRIANTPINGMVVRGGRLTTDVVWDDTDIVHVLLDEVVADTQFSLSGTIRLQSNANESLVVKGLGANAGITAAGVPLDITDRLGGSVQVVGMPNHPVIMTSLYDQTAGAGFTPDGQPQNDTHNVLGSGAPQQPDLSNSGPVIIDGGDRDDHGSYDSNAGVNKDGWKFMEQSVEFVYNNSQNTAGTGILVVGLQNSDDTPLQAQLAIESVASVLGLDLTYVKGTDINTVNFADYRMIYVPSDANDTLGGIPQADLDRLNARRLAVQNYVNYAGGGVFALTEAGSQDPYGWLQLPDPFVIQRGGGTTLTQTPLLAAAGFNITDQELTNGTPWHNSFIGPPGFNRMQVWVIDPNSGAAVTLGIGAGQGGIGTRATDPQPGDWSGIKLDDYSNDFNAAIANETELRFSPNGDTNGLPTTAQNLGELAPDVNSSDDTRRLGFEVHGSISQTASSPKGGDVDVYSFKAAAGEMVWIDIDRTASALDSVVELIDANGAVVARSDNSVTEQTNPSSLVGIAEQMQPGFTGDAGPFTTQDNYTINDKDAGMRVVLPGTAGTTNTYFVRVRAKSDNLNQLTGGLSKGEYVLQVRLQNLDVFPGSTVRDGDLRYANTGIQVVGKPSQSPLLADTISSTIVHDSFDTAQNIGNLLTSSTNEIRVAGSLTSDTQVQWFKMQLDYNLIQSIGDFSTALKTFATMFHVEYADGLAGPDTTLSVFDQNGNLLLIGRDSQQVDNQPRPPSSTMGADAGNLSHGSFVRSTPRLAACKCRPAPRAARKAALRTTSRFHPPPCCPRFWTRRST